MDYHIPYLEANNLYTCHAYLPRIDTLDSQWSCSVMRMYIACSARRE
jgi:hypothetical protein